MFGKSAMKKNLIFLNSKSKLVVVGLYKINQKSISRVNINSLDDLHLCFPYGYCSAMNKK